MVEEGAEEEDGLVRGERFQVTDVGKPAWAEEPITKAGGAIVHSLVVACSNQASVCFP